MLADMFAPPWFPGLTMNWPLGIMLQLPSLPGYNWTEGLQSALLRPLQTWLLEHPLVAWLVLHPIWGLALLGVGLLLFAGLWSAIARLTEGFWLTLVRLPFQLVASVFAIITGLLLRRWARANPEAEQANRLGEIIARLEDLQTEQDDLLQEMRQLLAERR
jgi:thiol:disulfide interchange protein